MEPKEVLSPHCSINERFMACLITSTKGSVLDEYPLSVEHFYTPAPRAFFSACWRLHEGKKAITEASIQSELGPDMMLAMGQSAFLKLCDYVSPAYAPTAYAILCEKLTLRRAERLGRWLLSETWNAGDIGQFCSTAVHMANELEVASESDNELETAVAHANERLDRMDRGDKPARRNMPVNAWNQVFGGIMDGRFYAIASRPGLGKTALMEQFITSYLILDETVVVFEKDMSPQMLVERIACREAKVPFWRYERETLSKQERDDVRHMLKALDPARLRIFNPVGFTAEKMCAIARREIRQHKAKAIFLDHIQCLRFPGKDLREGLTASSLAIRANVTETGVAHIVLAHINREGSKGRPQPENIKEFDQLFGDVDALALLWSEVEAADAKEDRPMKLYAAKNRGGAVVEESLNFNGPLLKFT
jgi:replicative DNA helicase